MKPISPVLRQRFIDCGFDEKKLTLLARYGAMIEQWQKAINLVSVKTIPDLWERHILDSAQLWPILQSLQQKPEFACIDLGSGGGLPGIVLAIAGIQKITMIESDKRKGIFLKEVSRELNLTNVVVISERIENTQAFTADIVTARALASLDQLLIWATPFLRPDGYFVFLKGADIQTEIAQMDNIDIEKIKLIPSITDNQAHVFVMQHDVPRETNTVNVSCETF